MTPNPCSAQSEEQLAPRAKHCMLAGELASALPALVCMGSRRWRGAGDGVEQQGCLTPRQDPSLLQSR